MVRDLRNIHKDKKKRKEPVVEAPVDELIESENDVDDESGEDEDVHYYRPEKKSSGFEYGQLVVVIPLIMMIVVVGILVTNVSFIGDSLVLSPEPTPILQAGVYTGLLTSMTYDENYYGQVTISKLVFADNNSFLIEGNVEYALGLQYTVVFTYYTDNDGNTIVTHVDGVALASS